MKAFVVHVSDARLLDVQAEVVVQDSMDLGRAAQVALDEVIEKHGRNIHFPVFIDIHPCAAYTEVAWMHSRGEEDKNKGEERYSAPVI